jgi:hypothetical protein
MPAPPAARLCAPPGHLRRSWLAQKPSPPLHAAPPRSRSTPDDGGGTSSGGAALRSSGGGAAGVPGMVASMVATLEAAAPNIRAPSGVAVSGDADSVLGWRAGAAGTGSFSMDGTSDAGVSSAMTGAAGERDRRSFDSRRAMSLQQLQKAIKSIMLTDAGARRGARGARRGAGRAARRAGPPTACAPGLPHCPHEASGLAHRGPSHLASPSRRSPPPSPPEMYAKLQAGLQGIGSLARETTQLTVNRDVTGATCINQYVVVKTLGRGSYGKVKLCLNTLDGQLYAIKVRVQGAAAAAAAAPAAAGGARGPPGGGCAAQAAAGKLRRRAGCVRTIQGLASCPPPVPPPPFHPPR